MKRKDPVLLDMSSAVKAARTAIRMKHSINADREINEVIPQIEEAIMEAAVTGKAYKINIAGLFEEVPA